MVRVSADVAGRKFSAITLSAIRSRYGRTVANTDSRPAQIQSPKRNRRTLRKMQPLDPIDLLFAASDALQQVGQPEAAEQFERSLDAYILDKMDPAKAFGLKGEPCKRSVRSRYLARRQRYYLLLVAEIIAPGATPDPRSIALAAEIDRFQRNQWPAWCDLKEPPPETSKSRSALFNARRCGPLPQGHRAVFDFLNSDDLSELVRST